MAKDMALRAVRELLHARARSIAGARCRAQIGRVALLVACARWHMHGHFDSRCRDATSPARPQCAAGEA
jgi:hypothetical protein